MKLVRALFTATLVAAFSLSAHAAKQKPTRPGPDGGRYKGAIVINAADGKVLFEDNADVVTPPASMTKLMTFAVLADFIRSGALALDTPVQITAEDAGMGGTQAYLDPRENFPVEDLIYAMMVQSANDAAHALARTAAGSRQAFIELMNAKARELGMTHSTFRTPHGLTSKRQRLEEGDLTTPRDFALLCRHLVQNTDVVKYTSVKVREFAPNRENGPMRMENHNKLLGKVAGVDGLKTGYTENAGYCLSATAERNGRRVIVIIMGSFGPGGQIDRGRSRDFKTIELIERGFAALPLAAGPVSSTAAAPANKASQAKPAPAAPAAPSASRTAPTAPAQTPSEASPIQPATPSSPVSGATEASGAAPAVKFELPQKKR